MDAMPILEVAIGLVFFYLLLSILCTAINEWIARAASLRSRNLKAGIVQLLEDPAMDGLARRFYDHHMIKSSTPPGRWPSYISSEVFARVIIDLIDEKTDLKTKDTYAGIKAALAEAELPAPVVRTLESLLDDADSTVADLRHNLQTWFDLSMERISGWYKRWTQLISLGVALLLAIAVNADSLAVGTTLWKNPALRLQVVSMAQVVATACDKENLKECEPLADMDQLQADLNVFPIGWNQGDMNLSDPDDLAVKFIGWLITAVAVSLGAPFWFDALVKLSNIRSAGAKPKPSVTAKTGKT